MKILNNNIIALYTTRVDEIIGRYQENVLCDKLHKTICTDFLFFDFTGAEVGPTTRTVFTTNQRNALNVHRYGSAYNWKIKTNTRSFVACTQNHAVQMSALYIRRGRGDKTVHPVYK